MGPDERLSLPLCFERDLRRGYRSWTRRRNRHEGLGRLEEQAEARAAVSSLAHSFRSR
jgi:hypothetical protein